MSIRTQPIESFRQLSKGEQVVTIVAWLAVTFIFTMFHADSFLFPTSVGILFGIVIGLIIGWATLIIVSNR